MEKKCCVTGHRNIPEERLAYVKEALKREVIYAAEAGYTVFISGAADGADLLFAEIVMEVKAQYADITLEMAVPYRDRIKRGNAMFQAVLKGCDSVHVVSETYSRECFMKRNRYMVDHSGRIIAVYDGRGRGGTAQTLRYALAEDKEIRVIGV